MAEFSVLQRVLYTPLRDRYERAKVSGTQGMDPSVFWNIMRMINFIVLPALGFAFGDMILSPFIK